MPALKGKTPAVDSALEYLRFRLSSGAWPSGCKLPTTNELAASTGVSVVSMCKAVNI
jgi:DNA-binding GntR family transcriptional regulator